MALPHVVFVLHLDFPPLLPDDARQDWWARTGARVLEASARAKVRLGLALAGPVVEFLHQQRGPVLEQLTRRVETGWVELVACPFYGPVLSSVPADDGADQIIAHITATRRLIDARPTGCWLPLGVWDPDVPWLMRRADIGWTLVEDAAIQAHLPGVPGDPWGAWRTERGGHAIGLLANDSAAEGFRGMGSADDFLLYLTGRASQGAEVVVLAWSLRRPDGDIDADVSWVIELFERLPEGATRRPEVVVAAPRGRVYLPSWAPPEVGLPWEQRLLASPQADRLHKRMLRVSRLLTRLHKRIRRNDPDAPDPDRIVQARRYLHRAQAAVHYDAEGIADPALRARAWHDLLRAEGLGEAAAQLDRRLLAEAVDLRTSGAQQVLLRTPAAVVVVDPAVGGGVVEFGHLAASRVLVDPDDGEAHVERAAFVEHLAGEPVQAHVFDRVSVERTGDAGVRALLAREATVAGAPVTLHKAYRLGTEPRLDVVFEVHTLHAAPLTGVLTIEVPLVVDGPLEALEAVCGGEPRAGRDAAAPRKVNEVLVVGGGHDLRLRARQRIEMGVVLGDHTATVHLRWPFTTLQSEPARLRLSLEAAAPGAFEAQAMAGPGGAAPIEGTEAVVVPDPTATPGPVPDEPVPDAAVVDAAAPEPGPVPPERDDAPPILGELPGDVAEPEVPEAPAAPLVRAQAGDTVVLQRDAVLAAPAMAAHARIETPAGIAQRDRGLVPPRHRAVLQRPSLYTPMAAPPREPRADSVPPEGEE